MSGLKNALLAWCIFSVIVILGGIVSEWAADVVLTSADLFDNVAGAVVVSSGLFVILGMPLAYVAKHNGLERSPKTLALWGLVGGIISMSSLILLVDGLPLFFPQDILLIASTGLGAATSGFVWASLPTWLGSSDV